MATLYTLHANHGVTVGQDITTHNADAFLGGLFRNSEISDLRSFNTPKGEPVVVAWTRDESGGVTNVLEFTL